MKRYIITYAQGMQADPCHRAFLQSIKDKVPSAELRITRAATKPGQVVHTRWLPILEELRKLEPEDLVLLADSRDLVFTRDPFPELETLGDLVFFSEGQRTMDHRWCQQQFLLHQRMTGSKTNRHCGLDEVNGGCLYGTAARLQEVAEHMAECSDRYAQTPLSDQPVLNHWVKNRGYHIHRDPKLYAHGELVRMRKWKGDPNDAAIYHQFDRVPEHKRQYLKTVGVGSHNITRVISRYKEKRELWTSFLPEAGDTIVYCKGPAPEPGEIVLPNVGYEAHTWLHHFYENYDSLPPITLCLQGDPGPHSRTNQAHVHALLEEADPEDFWFMPFTLNGSWQDHYGNPHHNNLKELRPLWKELLGYPCPTIFHSFYGGQFAVSRDAVRSRPRDLYAKARDLIVTKNDACVMERMWYNWFCH